MPSRSRLHRSITVVLTALATALPIAAVATPSMATVPSIAVAPRILGAGSASTIPGSYLVKLNDTAAVRAQGVAGRARTLSDAHHGTLGSVWQHAMNGFAVTMSEADAQALAAEPDVSYVEQNMRWRLAGSQANPPGFGLDRIDQRSFLLDKTFAYPDSAGQFANVYVVDSGIDIGNSDFGGRASYGVDTYDGDASADDCHGHGTAVAGVIGGSKYGVAKKAKLIAVRVFGCNPESSTTSVQDGLNWVIDHAAFPAVINLSISQECGGGPCQQGKAVADAVKEAISRGITVVAGAGNTNRDACNNPVPAVNAAITVGATHPLTDERWTEDGLEGSNYGPCVDIFAPGADIISDGLSGSTVVVTGTSIAAAFVSGVAALVVGADKLNTLTPTQVLDHLVANATRDALGDLGAGSPNLLLYSQAPLPSSAPTIALSHQADGRLALFGVNPDGFLYSRFETAPGSGVWGPWSHTASSGFYGVAVVPDANFRLELAALTPNGEVFHRQQLAVNSNSWLNWSSVDDVSTAIALTPGFDGKLEMYGPNPASGALRVRQQSSASSPFWRTSRPVGGPAGCTSAAAAFAGTFVQVIAVTRTGTLWKGSHTGPLGDGQLVWGLLDAADAIPMTETALAHNSDGSLELLGTNGHGGVWRRHNNAPAADQWTGWTQLPPFRLSHLAAETTDGLVTVVGVAPDGTIWRSRQTAPSAGTYSAWTQIDGQFKP